MGDFPFLLGSMHYFSSSAIGPADLHPSPAPYLKIFKEFLIYFAKCRTLIDVAIPADRNGVQKEAEKNLKYKSLCIEIQRTWNLKCTIVPVIIGASGIVTRSLRKHLEAVPGKHSIDSLQKTAVLGTAHSADSAAV